MKEKKLLKYMFLAAAIMVVIYIAAASIISLATDKVFVAKTLNLTNQQMYYMDGEPLNLDNLVCEMDNPDLIVFKGIEQRSDGIYWTMEPTMKGSGQVILTITDSTTGEVMDSTLLNVTKRGLIIDKVTGDFTHCRPQQLCMIFLAIGISILLIVGFVVSIRQIGFSYHSIFCIGLGIWAVIISVLMIIFYALNRYMCSLYSTLSGAPGYFILFTTPLIIVFAILLTISNISLIRHEGFRTQNALGIIISALMILGLVFIVFLDNIFNSGSEMQMKIWSCVVTIVENVYAVLESFLLGAVICGTRAARNKPKFDKDYIVILGCKIKADGTLYPLIRGRVDRAIRFYKDQFAATGKKAIFIPSGGQGSDEMISEGEAMKRYLIEQGFEESQIIAETNSVNTRQNMQFSMALMETDKKAVFSTTNFHVFRSGIIARQVGFDADGMGSPTKWYFWPNAYVREVIGMLSYKWKSIVIIYIPIVVFLIIMIMTYF